MIGRNFIRPLSERYAAISNILAFGARSEHPGEENSPVLSSHKRGSHAKGWEVLTKTCLAEFRLIARGMASILMGPI